jgi:mannose-6-phosphate isomerase
MQTLHPIRLEPFLRETLWGGRQLELGGWKQLPPGDIQIGESWETALSSIIQNGAYAGKTLGALVDELGPSLLGEQAIAQFGMRFPLLAKFSDTHEPVSVQVHPNDSYAAQHEGGQLGKAEFWYILAAEPNATIIHGFKSSTSYEEIHRAIQDETLENLLHREFVSAGDVIYVPAGTIHAVGGGVVHYELQEYSELTYRIYDYGRLTLTGKPRELHIDRGLQVMRYEVSPKIKVTPVSLPGKPDYEDTCLVACQHFVTRKVFLKPQRQNYSIVYGKTDGSCIILTALNAQIRVCSGSSFQYSEQLSQGQTIILPAALGKYRIEGYGTVLFSYVPKLDDEACNRWKLRNS